MPDAPYQRQFFICTYGAWCRLEGSDEVRTLMKKQVKEAGLQNEVRITKSGCLGQCGHGPVAVLWPENVWYHRITQADVRELVEEQVVHGRPVERLRYRPEKAGSNKTEAVRKKEAEKGTHIE